MNSMELMKARHSVRKFIDKPLTAETAKALQAEIDACNKESGLHIQLITNEPEAFQAGKPSYGQFKCCKNYLALVGAKGNDEKIGYYGERIVLKAQSMGVNSCWVAMTYKKGKADVKIGAGEKLYMVVALGYGETQGASHKIKTLADISDYQNGDPDWYKAGLEAALLAPTAINQQKFKFERNGKNVKAKAGLGLHAKTDLGIVKYHFELGAGNNNFSWA